MDTVIDISLKPIWWKDYPTVKVSWDSEVLFDGAIDHYHVKTFNPQGSPGTHYLGIEFYGKQDSDTVIDKNLDKAIVIENISIEGMSYSSFMHSAKYYPTYPASYAETCRLQGTELPEYINGNYLGWNGKWVLELEFPIFTWIHKTENLGWIYEKTL